MTPEEKLSTNQPPELPPIRMDEEVSDDEPHIEAGKRKASLPAPVPFNPREK